MAFPVDPLEPVVELYLDGWQDISDTVFVDRGISITRGRADEAGQVAPTRCNLTLDNRTGDFSPRNPVGAYYGLLGRNTPMRVSLPRFSDDYNRTVATGWGTAASGEQWGAVYGSGGTVAAGNASVSGGAARHSVPTTNAHRITRLLGQMWRDVEVAVTFTLPVADVLGGSIEPANIVFRSQVSISDYYLLRVEVTAADTVAVGLRHISPTAEAVIANPVTVAGLTHTGQALRVRAHIEGHTVRARVWPATGPEPAVWHLVASDPGNRTAAPGLIGIRTGVSTGVSNPLPIVVSYEDFEVRLIRTTVEVSAWPQRWNVAQTVQHVPIEASGILRRLGQGSSPLQSALRRGISTAAPSLVAYWPAEDTAGATSFASGLASGGAPMRIVGTPRLASYTAVPASEPLPNVASSTWVGDVPLYTGTGLVQVRAVVGIPVAGVGGTGDLVMLRVLTGGTIAFWDVHYVAGGFLAVRAYNTSGVEVLNTGNLAFAVNGRDFRIGLQLVQNGANIDYTISTLGVGDALGLAWSGTLNSHSVDRCGHVIIAPYGNITDLNCGQITVQSVATSIYELDDQLDAYVGERAGRRMERLCQEEGVPFSHTGDLDTTAPMGPQLPDEFLVLMHQAATADGGTLYEPRGAIELTYRTHASLYNQPAQLAVTYGQLSPPLEPVDDDQATRNDVTITRTGGSSYRAVQATGPMSTANPPAGVGRYPTAVSLMVESDSQLRDIATWQRHLGTVDEARYPTIRFELATAGFADEPDLFAAALALSIDDRLTIADPPAGQPPDQIAQLVRGMVERIEPYSLTIDGHCSPAAPYEVLQLDDANSRLGSDTSTVVSLIGAADTLLTVAVADGTLWTTDPAQMPIPITIGGEAMHITAVAGSVSPQTFTVDRSVNGVVKSHGAGAPVRLTRRAAWAL